jgi:hypothetical protein
MKLSAHFSPDRKYRYLLERQWSALPSLVWIMLNPSTGTESQDDPTIRRCMGFSINAGYGRCRIFNLFALCSTAPCNLLSTKNSVGAPENDNFLRILAIEKPKIVCAWGCMYKKLLWRPLEVLKILPDTLYYLKPTKTHGEPHHPLYLSSKLRPVPMDRQKMIEVYEKRIGA